MKRTMYLVLFTTLAAAQLAHAQCTKDTDCKGDRICVKGACAAPAASTPAVPEVQPQPAAPPAATLTEPMILQLYMRGDVTSAIDEARQAQLAELGTRLTAVADAYRAAWEAKQAGRTDDAIAQYERVLQADRALTSQDNAYSNAARQALAELYAQRAPRPGSPPPLTATPSPVAPVTGFAPAARTINFTGRRLKYTVNGQSCTAPCTLTLADGADAMEVEGLGRFRLSLTSDITRVEAKKGSPAAAIIGGIGLATVPLFYWLSSTIPPDCVGTRCSTLGQTFAYLGTTTLLVLSLIALPLGIYEAVRTQVLVNGHNAYRAEVRVRPLMMASTQGGFMGLDVSF